MKVEAVSRAAAVRGRIGLGGCAGLASLVTSWQEGDGPCERYRDRYPDSPPLLSSGYSRLISHWTKRWWCGLLPPQMTTPWCYVLGFIWRQHTEYDTHESSCASPSNATPGVRPLGRTPRISSTATAFLWRQWPDPSAAFKYGLGLYPRQAIGRSATDWWKSYRDHVQIIYLLSPNNQWPAINWQQFIHWLGSRNKQVPARHSYSRYEYKEII